MIAKQQLHLQLLPIDAGTVHCEVERCASGSVHHTVHLRAHRQDCHRCDQLTHFQLVDIEQHRGGSRVSPLKGETGIASQHLFDQDHISSSAAASDCDSLLVLTDLMLLPPSAQSRPTSPGVGASLSPKHIISISDEKEKLLIDYDCHQVTYQLHL